MNKPPSALRLLIPAATLFFSSGCIVVLEVVASRLVARALGSSPYTWTFVAAVVLAGLTLGGFAGGRIADRFHPRRALAVLLALASSACVALVIVNNVIAEWTWLWQLSWPTHVLFHVCLVFLAPSTLLGAVGPVIARIALDQGVAPGRTLGTIFGWAAAGAITGLVLAGSFLIPNFGSTVVIWALGAALLTAAFLYWVSCWALYLWAMVFAALATMGMAPADWARDAGQATGLREPNDPSVLYEAETAYGHVAVRQISETPDRRALSINQSLSSEMVMGDVTDLRSLQAEVCAALMQDVQPSDRPFSMMILGGADYTLTRYVKAKQPNSRVEVVQFDPGVLEAAQAAFGMARDTTIHTIAADPRHYVNELTRDERASEPDIQYDLIYTDAAGNFAVPFDLATAEFDEKVSHLIADGGFYIVSLTDVRGQEQLLGAVVNTLDQSFSHVYVVRGAAVSSGQPQTFVVVASQSECDVARVLSGYDAHLAFSVLDEEEMTELTDRVGDVILTDDMAPVESMLAAAVRRTVPQRLAGRYLRDAARFQAERRYNRSIASYRRAAKQDPAVATRAYNAIALIQVEQGNRQDAIESLEHAIASHVPTGLHQTSLAGVYANLAALLVEMDRKADAKPHWDEASRLYRVSLERHPDSAYVWDQLGQTLVRVGKLSEAADAFEKTIALDPDNLANYDTLAKLLEVQKRYDDAISVARRQLDVLKQRHQRDAVLELTQYIDFLEYQRVKE